MREDAQGTFIYENAPRHRRARVRASKPHKLQITSCKSDNSDIRLARRAHLFKKQSENSDTENMKTVRLARVRASKPRNLQIASRNSENSDIRLARRAHLFKKQSETMNKYPIYIPSKGRAKTRHTAKALDRMNVNYYIVVEPAEFGAYAKHILPEKILVLPQDNMKLIGSRNWIKAHSIRAGHLKHWQLDDNITKFSRLNRNMIIRVTTDAMFRAAEDFCDRYENIAFAGFQYDYFAISKFKHPAFAINRRIYSCTLIDNKFNYAWRSIYNDDTDVCIRALKNGLCTVLFYAFLQHKISTMHTKGGNTEELYLIDDGRLKMAEALAELHPDIVQVKEIFDRAQHWVDYRGFKGNELIMKSGLEIVDAPNEYGMILVDIKTPRFKFDARRKPRERKRFI